MSNDHFTEVTHESWLSRIGGAIVGVLVGLLLFVVSFPLLFWNEGRSVKEYKSLKEGAGAVVSVDPSKNDPANIGKLVHLSGTAVVSGSLSDEQFRVSAEAVKLRRIVEVYQWKESTQSESQKKLGGGQETATTYSYEKSWASERIESKNFKQPAGHENPATLAYSSEEKVASSLTVGNFSLSPGLIAQMDEAEPLPLDEKMALPETFTFHDGGLYQGKSPQVPEIGDVRVRFEVVKPGPVSILARQGAQALEPYQTRAGNKIERLEPGTKTAAEMFTAAKAENATLTVILRVVGFLVMFIGLALVTRPLSVVADLVPFVGNIVGAGTGMVSFLIALALSSLTVAVAWIVYRPLLAVVLIAVTVGCVVLLRKRMGKAVSMASV
jgi:hypothetical protein